METIEIKTQAELNEALKLKNIENIILRIFGGTQSKPIVVVGRGSSNLTVVGRGSSNLTVVGAENSIFRIYSDVDLKLFQQAAAIVQDCSPKILHQDQTTQMFKTIKALHNLNSFLAINELEPVNGKVTLYKYVRDDFKDHYSGTLSYEPGKIVTEPKWDPDPERQCGRDLHLSALLRDAQKYNSTGHAIACEVELEDIVIYGPDITKVRCREVKVIGEVQND